MNRLPFYRAFAIPILLCTPLLCAQVPYEYFEIHELTAPENTSDADIPELPPMLPSQLELDSQTQTAGNLRLSDPFAPSVGIYKRRSVFSKIVLNHGVFAFENDTSECAAVSPNPNPSPLLKRRRSARIFAFLTPNDVHDLPADSPEMVIASISAIPIGANANDRDPIITVSQCASMQYTLKASKPALYRIDYETASWPDSSVPKTADFFLGAIPDGIPLTDEQNSVISDFLESYPQIKNLRGKSNALSRLIEFFQHFSSAPLSNSDADPAYNAKPHVTSELMHRIMKERKGLCRHRAFLFALIARHWGYAVQIAANEVHAFVEIRIHNRWYPIELGGRAQSLTIQSTNPSSSSQILNSYSFFESAAQNQPNNSEGMDNSKLFKALDFLSNPRGMMPDALTDTPTADMASSFEPAGAFVQNPDFPHRIMRNADIDIKGRVLDKRLRTAPNASIQMELHAHSESVKPIRIRTKSDSDGFIHIQMRLPPNWPVGQSEFKWFILK